MRWIKYVLVFGIIVLMAVIVVMLFPKNRIVEKDYFEKASLAFGYYFSHLEETKGTPEDEKLVKSDDMYFKNLIYDGYVYSSDFYKDEATMPDDCHVRLVTITDLGYKIGSRNVGVSSTRKDIEKAYKYSKPISDLSNASDIGYIDGGVWVVFSFSPDDIVTQIQIYYGP